MREATRLTQAGRLNEATEALQRALGGRPAAATGPAQAHTHTDGPLDRLAPMGRHLAQPLVLDGCVFEPVDRAAASCGAGTGVFIEGSHTHASLTRRYKLYVPPSHAGQCLPLVVMLHGCTQDPDDFAAGTGMNQHACEQGFFVLYPAQAQDANPSRCWNWFKHNHQRRESGEAALLADLTRSVIDRYGLDTRRVYIAGLSAGGAMAATVAALFPELFAAAGVHSGLASGAAGNLAEALAAMKSGSGASAGGYPKARRFGAAPERPPLPQTPVPTIVFHGDQDQTVHPRNGQQVIAAALGGTAGATGSTGSTGACTPTPATARVEQGISANGKRYTRTTHDGGDGTPLAEHWLVHGAGHAWSGGLATGSYTDASGPDASSEMLRFFFAQARGARH